MDNNNYQMPPDYSQMMPDYSYNDPYAFRVGFGRRLGAFLIDYLIFNLIFLIALLLTGKMEEIMSTISGSSFDFKQIIEASQKVAPLSWTIYLMYFSLEAFIGATIGKLTMGIRIASIDQNHAPLNKLIIRFVVKNTDRIFLFIGLILTIFSLLGFLAFIAIIIGYFFIFGQKKQGFHDMIAGTAVYYNEDIIKSNTGNF